MIALEHLYIVHAQLAGNMSKNYMPVFQPYLKHRIAQCFFNYAAYLNYIVLRHDFTPITLD
jgi:hypothetical protein